MKARLALLLLALVACSLALAACGGGKSDEDKITENIETAALAGEKTSCTELETQGFVEQTTGEKGDEAISNCEKEAGTNTPKSVEVTDVEVDGSNATANVAFEGGNFNGNALQVGLVEEDETWKLDEAVKFTKFDQKSLLEGLQSALEEPETKLSAAEAGCIVEGLEPLDQKELEGLLLKSEAEPIIQTAEACAEI